MADRYSTVIGGLEALRKALFTKIISKVQANPSIERASIFTPNGRMMTKVGDENGVDIAKSAELDKWLTSLYQGGVNLPEGLPKVMPSSKPARVLQERNTSVASAKPDVLWGTAHNHPSQTKSHGGMNWADNGPSDADVELVTRLPKNSDHQIIHPDDMTQEFLDVPSYKNMVDFVSDVGGVGTTWGDPNYYMVLNPRLYQLGAKGIALPPQFSTEGEFAHVGAINRAIQQRLSDRGLLNTSNTGTPEDNAAIQEAAAALKKVLPFKRGGLAQRHG